MSRRTSEFMHTFALYLAPQALGHVDARARRAFLALARRKDKDKAFGNKRQKLEPDLIFKRRANGSEDGVVDFGGAVDPVEVLATALYSVKRDA